MPQNKNDRRKEKGFTLIEIIAVLVILGILAAVAVPKYFDLQANAEQQSLNAAGAELQARVNQYFAQQLIANNGACAAARAAVEAANGPLYDDGTGTLLTVSGWTVGGLAAINFAGAATTGVVTLQNPDNTINGNYTLNVPTCE